MHGRMLLRRASRQAAHACTAGASWLVKSKSSIRRLKSTSIRLPSLSSLLRFT